MTTKKTKKNKDKKLVTTKKKLVTTKKPLKKSKPKRLRSKKESRKKVVLKNKPSKRNFKKRVSVNYQSEDAFLASIDPYKINKKEKYMCAKQKHHFLKILERWEEILQSEQDKTADEIQNNISQFSDEADRATHEEGFALEVRTRERERRLIQKISDSLEDLHKGDYGYCLNPNCGVEIGIRRLEARPTANLCIDCKTLEEIKEKQQFG